MSIKKLVYALTTLALVVMTVAPAGNFAKAATLSAGDLIKASGDAVYYYGSDGKRYVFPNEKTYKTWYNDFANVKTITDSELAAISLSGKNVVYRAGTRLVKITTDPKVYALTAGGVLHWVTTEAVAKALYGDNWASRIDDLSDAFYSNYTVGADITSNVHPDGSLVKYAGSSDVYVIDGGYKRKVATEAAFNANRFNWNNVLTIADTITYSNGTDLAGAESKYTETAQLNVSGGGVGVTPGGALTVSLAANTPAASNVPAGATPATDVPFTALNLNAGSTAVTLTGLYITRTGLSVDGDLSGVKLYDASMTQLGTTQTFNADHKAKFNFTKTIAANSTETIYVYADNAANKTGYIKLGVDSATDILSNASGVMGTFPVYGNTMAQVNVSVGAITIAKGPNNPTGGTVDIDMANQRFMQVRLTSGSTEDMRLQSISFMKGDNATFADGDLINYKLYNDKTGAEVGTATMVNNKLTFNVSPEILIKKGEYVDVSLKADVVSGAGKIITFALIDSSAWLLRAVGASYNFGAAYSPAGSTGVDFGSGTATKAETANTTINQGKLQVAKGPNCPATGNIAIGGSDQKIAAWKFTAKGEEIRVGQIAVTLNETAGFDADVDATMYKLVDSTGKVWAGPYDASGTTVTFSSQVNFPVGDTELFLTAKVASSGLTAGTDKISAQFNPSTALTNVKGIQTNKTVTPTPNANIAGNTMTAQKGALTANMGSTPIVGTMIIGSVGAEIANVKLDATAGGEDVKITSMTLTMGNAGGVTAEAEDFANYKLFDGSTQVGKTEEYNTAGDGGTGVVVFTIDNGYVVPKNEIKTLKVVVDAVNPAAAEISSFDVTSITAVGKDSGVSVTPTYGTTDSPQQTWQAVGRLVVNLDADSPVAKQMVAGTTGNEVTKYKLSATWEDVDVTQLNLWAGSAANTATQATNIAANVNNVKVYKGTTLLGTTSFGTNGKAVLNIDAGNLRIKKDESVVITIKVDLSEKAVLTSSNDMWVGIGDSTGDGSEWTAAGNYLIVANGVSSGTTITAANIDSVGDGTGSVYGGVQMVAYDGVLTVSLNSSSPAGAATAGAGKEVLRLDLTATGADITVTNIEYIKGGSCTITGTSIAKWASADGSTTYYSWAAGTAWLNASRRWTGGTAGSTLTIAAGSTKTVKLTGDTTGCTTNDTLQFSIYGSVLTSGIVWGDGEATGIDTTLTKNIPVYGGTLSY